MGRPIKNPTHALARLRAELSTKNHKVTRKELARKVGIPETSLRDVENGKYKMTPEVATQIAYAVGGVNPRSLLEGDNPLLDLFRQQPFSKDSPTMEPLAWAPEHQVAMEQLFSAAMDAAREKKIALLFSFLFETWLSAALQTFTLDTLFLEKLTERLPAFDPKRISSQFCPKNKQMAKKWETIEKQLSEEEERIRDEDWVNNSDYFARIGNLSILPPAKTEAERVAVREYLTRIYAYRGEARKRLCQQHEDEAKASPPKPLSGKRPRSPGRPEA